MINIQLAIALITAGVFVGFAMGFALRAYISAWRRKRQWRKRFDQGNLELPTFDRPASDKPKDQTPWP